MALCFKGPIDGTSALLQLLTWSRTGLNEAMHWWYKSGSALTHVAVYCRAAPSHYLNRCWLIIIGFWGNHPRTTPKLRKCSRFLSLIWFRKLPIWILLPLLPATNELTNYFLEVQYSKTFLCYWTWPKAIHLWGAKSLSKSSMIDCRLDHQGSKFIAFSLRIDVWEQRTTLFCPNMAVV